MYFPSSCFIQLRISPEIILTFRSNIDSRLLQILPHHPRAILTKLRSTYNSNFSFSFLKKRCR